MTAAGNSGETLLQQRPCRPMPFSFADISIQLLMDATKTLQEIERRMTARAFGAVHNPEKGPDVRRGALALLKVFGA